MEQRFVVIDVETTGNSPSKGDKIIQLAAVVIENDQITEKYSTYINPNKDIPLFIEQLTGITNDIVQDAPPFFEVAPKIKELLQNAYFVAHNVLFDLAFIQEELKNCGYQGFVGKKIDTVELSRILLPTSDSFKLNFLAKNFSFKHENPHQADSDAHVTAELLLALFAKLEQLPAQTIKKIRSITNVLHSEIDEILYDIYQRKLQGLNEDEKFFDFYKEIAIKKVNKREYQTQPVAIDYESLKGQLIQNMQSVFEKYEYRKGQFEMMDVIHHAIDTNQYALIEAGTGIGKTFAYLFPSIIYSKMANKPVIVSTYTKSLQQQILYHDFPMLKKILPFDVRATILKGRSNYISLKKFHYALTEEGYNYDEILTILQILVWLTETESGDLDEINLPSGGKLFLEKINSYTSEGLRFNFYQRALDNAQDANIIITNHAYLLNDVAKDKFNLPSHDIVIYDEAHHIENAANEQLGLRLHYVSLANHFMRIGTLTQKGLLFKIYTLCNKNNIHCDESFHSMENLIQTILFELDEFFRIIRLYALKNSKTNYLSTVRYRYNIETEHGMMWSQVKELILRIVMNINELNEQFNKQKDELFLLNQLNISEKIQFELTSYFSFQAFLDTLKSDLHCLFFQKDDRLVTWIEFDAKSALNGASIHGKIIEIGDMLANEIFSNKKSIIFTSATLKVEDSFDFAINQLGLEYFYPICKAISSPFQYDKQAKLMIPTDLPEINQVSQEEYVQAISSQIAKIAIQTQGRMLILFTSSEMLKQTYLFLKELKELEDFILIGQGISGGSHTKLTKNFQQFPKSILLGTNSFWEGIDLSCEDLTVLIIVRLPFASPGEPMMEAKCQHFKAIGENPFEKLSLPYAITRFKQGFGRLVRNNTDKGVMFVFDKRIVTKSYGKNFIQSLPNIETHVEPLSKLLKHLNMWL